jgi:hypothetical protein
VYDASFNDLELLTRCAHGIRRKGRPKVRFQNDSGLAQGLTALPVHTKGAVNWHSGVRGGAHARPKATPVHHAARRRSGVFGFLAARRRRQMADFVVEHRVEPSDNALVRHESAVPGSEHPHYRRPPGSGAIRTLIEAGVAVYLYSRG